MPSFFDGVVRCKVADCWNIGLLNPSVNPITAIRNTVEDIIFDVNFMMFLLLFAGFGW